MKIRLPFLILALCMFTASPLVITSCSTPASQRSEAKTTLLVLGSTVDASMKVAAKLYRDGVITASKWNEIADIHAKFQSAYNLAVAAVQADLSSIASPDLVALAGQLVGVVQQFVPPSK